MISYEVGRKIAVLPIVEIGNPLLREKSKEERIVVINPEIKERSEAFFEVWDTCFSAGVAFFGKVERHCSINVEFYNEYGKKVVREFGGDLSELFQHEIDQLNRVLFVDHLVDNQVVNRNERAKLSGW